MSTTYAAQAPVGAGFTVTAGDLSFILKQINIAERHAATATSDDICKGLVNQPGDNIPDVEQVPDALTSYGLRTVDGTCNNLVPGREKYSASDTTFPRLAPPNFRDAEVPGIFGPPGAPATSYKQKTTGNVVVDSQPRVISNLIVDQTATNPAAIQAAGHPVRTQGNPGVAPCAPGGDPSPADPNGNPDNCIPAGETLPIPNVTTDVGLSPPFNGLFTIFGQFFDHGVDQTVKSGGTVFVPLKDDDPLVVGKDGVLGTPDDLPANLRFMVLTRAQNQPGPDGILGNADDIQDANNTDTPLVDQSQTYTSHSSHQAFLREYALDANNHPVDTGRLLGGPSIANGLRTDDLLKGGMATWATVKWQAEHLLGLHLEDVDALNIPMLAVDPYGNFLPGRQRPTAVRHDHRPGARQPRSPSRGAGQRAALRHPVPRRRCARRRPGHRRALHDPDADPCAQWVQEPRRGQHRRDPARRPGPRDVRRRAAQRALRRR